MAKKWVPKTKGNEGIFDSSDLCGLSRPNWWDYEEVEVEDETEEIEEEDE